MEEKELNEKLAKLKGWTIQENSLYREFRFNNFNEAFGFMTRVALEAEKMDHHPDLKNSYNKVEIYLFTHDQKEITEKDFQLAKAIDGFAEKL